MNRVLIVDTGFSSLPIYNYLNSLGYEVHVIGMNPADCLAKIAKTYHQIDYSDSEKLAKIIVEKDYGHVVPGCTDVSYKTCAKLRPLFDFINTDSLFATDILLQKKYFRQFCRKKNIPVPKLVESMAKAKSELIVVKPVDAYSGRGIAILGREQENEINEAIATAKLASTCGDYLIEEHVAGQLYSHSAFIAAKKVVFDVIVEEHGSANKFAVDTSWVVHDFPTCYLTRIRESIEKITSILGLTDGLVHTQFILCNHECVIIEITRRCPGDLYSQLVELSVGCDYVPNYTRALLGQEMRFPKTTSPRRYVLRHTITENEPFTYGSLEFKEPLNIVKFISLATAGDSIKKSPAGRVGVLFAEVSTYAELQKLANKFINRTLYVNESH